MNNTRKEGKEATKGDGLLHQMEGMDMRTQLLGPRRRDG